jgi:hypothetical protein
MTPLHDYLRGKGRDSAGRRLADVWALSDADLELQHDFIQWMFPLTEPSSVMPDAPVLDLEEVAKLRADSVVRANLRRSFDRMLGFYGLAWGPERSGLMLSPYFPQQAANWLSAGNHNFLRITRILKSLMLFGETRSAAIFIDALEALYKRGYGRVIGQRSLEFWREAVGAKAA